MIHQTWSYKLDYILTLLGYGIGVGTLWKWPYLCMRNGGGAFLIPFTIFTLLGTIPCVFLETTIGQFSQSGAVRVWNLCPPFKGVGLGAILISWSYSTYYTVLLSWFLYYFYYSFFPNIPWTSCDNDWNTPTCISKALVGNETATNSSNIVNSSATNTSVVAGMTAAEEFWRYKVLELSDGLEHIGGPKGATVACLAVTYTIVFLCVVHGIKISGKVVYITVLLPYILITVFLVRGCLLPGAGDGIYYYMYPKFEKLLDPKIWIEGAAYALYSVGVGWGCLTTMAGHNKLNNNCFRDAFIIPLADAVSTVYAGFAFFSIMGHVAHLRGVTVDAFQSSGFNLGFIVYPEAVASLPLPQLWSGTTFVLMLTLGIDSLVPCFEIVITAVIDQFPRFAHRRWLVILAILLSSFIISLVYTTQGGMYVLTLMDWYGSFPSMLVFAVLEIIAVSWIYGTDRMNRDIMLMWGKTPPRMMSICLKFICPALMLMLFIYSLYSYRPPKYGDYIYPAWATGIGWMISFSSIVPVPVIFIRAVYKTPGDTVKEKLINALKPNKTWRQRTECDTLHREEMKLYTNQ